MAEPQQIKSSIKEIRDLIAEYPNSAIPIGAVFCLLTLASIIKTLIDGFSWSYQQWGVQGLALITGLVLISSGVLIVVIRRLIRARPIIEPLASPLLSKCPTLRWQYDGEQAKEVKYRVEVTPVNGAGTTMLNVPKRMNYRELIGQSGELMLRVSAVSTDKTGRGEKVISSSSAIFVELYENSLQRIKETNTIYVAVHADPGEDIFCHFDGQDWQGFDIELSKIIAAELKSDISPAGPEFEIVPVFHTWPEVISSPNTFEVDFAIASISISDERRRKNGIIFSQHYAQSELGVVSSIHGTEQDSANEIHLDSLIDRKVAVHCDTTASQLFDRIASDSRYEGKFEVVVARSNAEVMELLTNGSVDAVIYDYTRAFTFLNSNRIIRQLQHDIEIEQDMYGLTFAPVNSALCEKINAIIENNYDQIQQTLLNRIEAKQHANS